MSTWPAELPAADQTVLAAIRAGLRDAADPEKAEGMQRYLKSTMPCWGVYSKQMRVVFDEVVLAHPLPDRAAWRDTVLHVWRHATHREERYGALSVCGHRVYAAHRAPEALPLYEELIVTGAWWDLIDGVASHRLGELIRSHHGWTAPRMRRWAVDDDMWKRRSAIICQLGSKSATDLDLIEDCIEPNLDDREFFIRKAIGWALRELSKTDPEWVIAFVDRHEDRLSGLSRREGLKHLVRIGAVDRPA